MSQIEDLLGISPEIREDVRRYLKVNQEDVEEKLVILREWMAQTPHLPEEKSDSRLEYVLVHHKISVEKTKLALEGYYTARSVIGDYFDKLVPHTISFQKAKNYTCCVVVMPKLTKDFSRITIHKLSNVDAEIFDPMDALLLLLMITDIRLCEDYNFQEIIILDLSGYSLKHLVKFTPKVIKKLRYILMKVLNYRVKDIHLVNVPQFTDKLLPIFRSLIPGKTYKKVHVHSSIEHFHQFIPPQYLPKDYEGEQESLMDLFHKWCEELEFWEPFFAEHMYMKSDEKKRIGRNHEFEIFGTGSEGSFKKINVQL